VSVEHGVQPLPSDRLTPQPRRERPARRDGKKGERAFDVPRDHEAEPDASQSHARTNPESHDDGTGSRLDVTA
jgi:hypothetical protein